MDVVLNQEPHMEQHTSDDLSLATFCLWGIVFTSPCWDLSTVLLFFSGIYNSTLTIFHLQTQTLLGYFHPVIYVVFWTIPNVFWKIKETAFMWQSCYLWGSVECVCVCICVHIYTRTLLASAHHIFYLEIEIIGGKVSIIYKIKCFFRFEILQRPFIILD